MVDHNLLNWSAWNLFIIFYIKYRLFTQCWNFQEFGVENILFALSWQEFSAGYVNQFSRIFDMLGNMSGHKQLGETKCVHTCVWAHAVLLVRACVCVYVKKNWRFVFINIYTVIRWQKQENSYNFFQSCFSTENSTQQITTEKLEPFKHLE